ncbi:MAG: hypothetical protein GX107_01195 [Clostridiales bacterium]|nr:hypothetical protein [Clostridiales bacterium]
MKHSSKTAIGGIVSALSLTLLFMLSVIPFLTYALPALAGALIIIIVIELGKSWAAGVYATVSILAVLLVPNKEAAVMYVAFFGYYPIIKSLLESRMKKLPSLIIKTAVFSVSMLASYYLMIKFMGVEFDEIETFGKFAVPILLGAGIAVFLLYDYTLSAMIYTYMKRWRKRLGRVFK